MASSPHIALRVEVALDTGFITNDDDVSTVVDWTSIGISVAISIVAIAFAALTWLESRKQRRLLETMMKALPYATRRKRRTSRGQGAARPHAIVPGSMPRLVDSLKAAAEERRRLRVELEREKHEWQKSKDVAKALGWILERLGESDEEYEDE